ncbi:PI-stichotoxin-Hcr2m-like [Penaeus vannamei]|uniref:PI-stichotoxin-Hcr2m-like n=1 Tax=Penaeus vannamei TaxID=6689 RepID=UPI00387F875C
MRLLVLVILVACVLGEVAALRGHPVCLSPMEVGPCGGRLTRFYFDAKEGECKKFTYGGCMGNLNNFVTMRACRKACE